MTPNRKRLVNFLLTDSNQTKTPSGKSTSTAAGNRSWQKEQTRRIMIYNHANLDSQQKGGYPAALKLSKNQKSLIKNYNNAQGSAVEADRTLAFRSTGVSLFGKPWERLSQWENSSNQWMKKWRKGLVVLVSQLWGGREWRSYEKYRWGNYRAHRKRQTSEEGRWKRLKRGRIEAET